MVSHRARRLAWWLVVRWDYRWVSYLITKWLTKAMLFVIYCIIMLGGGQRNV